MNVFCASAAICASTAPRNVGSASSTVTSAPRRRQTEPISRPITPEPTMPSVFGTASIAQRAVVGEDASSRRTARPAAAAAFEPVATMTCLPLSVSAFAPATATCQRPPSPRPANEPRPWKKRDLVLLEEIEDAVVVLLHDGLLARQHLGDVDRQASRRRCRGRRSGGRRARSSRTTAAAPSTGCSRRWCRCRRAPGPPLSFFHSSMQATEKPSCAARIAAM